MKTIVPSLKNVKTKSLRSVVLRFSGLDYFSKVREVI